MLRTVAFLIGLCAVAQSVSGAVSFSKGEIVADWGSGHAISGRLEVCDARTGGLIDMGTLQAKREANGDLLVIPSRTGIGLFRVRKGQGITIDFKPAQKNLQSFFVGVAHWGTSGFVCRVEPESTSQLAQFAIGRPSSKRCNALFDPKTDTALSLETPDTWVPTAEGWNVITARSSSIVLSLRIVKDCCKRHGYRWYKPMDTSAFDRAPGGWCSWYCYYERVTEDDIVKNVDWIAENLKPYGCEYVQLDDGYQTSSWTIWNKKFPHGGKWLAERIHSRGLKAGLWLTPFSNADKDLAQQHPDWFIHTPEGQNICTFKLPYTLDGSNPAAVDGVIKPLYQTLALDWKYDYFKHDGQVNVTKAYSRAKFCREGVNPDVAYRNVLQGIRDVVGNQRFMLSCANTAIEGIGIANGSRTGDDVRAEWGSILPAYDGTRTQTFLNNVAWITDPDVVCVRDPLTLEQARLWASMVSLSGQLFMASDKMPELPEERVEILKRAFPVQRIVPMDIYPFRHSQMQMLDVKIARTFGSWDVVGIFNWGDFTRTLAISPKTLGLSSDRGYHVYDFWGKRYLGVMTQDMAFSLPPTQCMVLAVTPVENHPQVISTSRHIVQGAPDLKDVRWNPKTAVLSGRSEIVAGDEYRIRVAVPPGLQLADGTGKKVGWRITEVVLCPKTSGEFPWSVKFKRTALVHLTIDPVDGLQARADGQDVVRLTWKPCRHVFSGSQYVVLRNGKPIAQTVDCSYVDKAVRCGSRYGYSVRASWPGVGESTACASVSAVLPPLRNVYLDELHQIGYRQGYGTLQLGRAGVGAPMSIGGTKYTHGLGTVAESWVAYEIGGQYTVFDAEIGIDNTAEKGKGTVTYEVWGDGKKLFDSGLVRGSEAPRKISVPIKGVRMLELVVTDGGDTNWWDHADWADAHLKAK